MAILPVLTFPDPVLRQQCVPVSQFDERIVQLVANMFDTMDIYNGVGLAAPQVGILECIICIRHELRRFAIVNPVITSQKGTTSDQERCLSCPGLSVNVERADRIVVTGKTPEGKPMTWREQGYVSRIIQHEVDHLHGILIEDKRLGSFL